MNDDTVESAAKRDLQPGQAKPSSPSRRPRLIECVFNVSEGRDAARIERIGQAVRDGSGCYLLDVHSDPDHHRSVFTVVGEPDALPEGVFRASRTAIESIDLRQHRGIHPRIGAVDVVPFVPLAGVTMDECVATAREFGARLAAELSLPVFLYDRASTGPRSVSLPQIRRGGLAALFGADGPAGAMPRPDFGPDFPHATAGAVAVGARPILIAFNVLLAGSDLAVARAIARRIRERDGGLPAVRALGLSLESSGRTQVSMNLIDYRRTSLLQVMEAIRREAARHGASIESSELVGLAPRAAFPEDPESTLSLRGFGPDRILEVRVREESGVELRL